MLRNPVEKPLLFLFIVFFSYLLVDLGATFTMDGRIDEWAVPLIHFMSGFILIAVYFSGILPCFFRYEKKVLAVIFLILLITGVTLLKIYVLRQIHEGPFLSKAFWVTEFLRQFHFLAITSAVRILIGNLRLRKERFEMEMNHQRLRIEHLSMQLSPHFLKNVLTLFGSRMIKLSPDLYKEFSQLSSLLQYATKEFGLSNSLKEEISAISHYLEIQKLRFSDLSMNLLISADRTVSALFPMPKMCLITLVENVFFHGDFRDPKSPCEMEFELSPDESGYWQFRVSISNKVQKNDFKVRSGFGASAVFRVLAAEFGQKFHYTVDSDDLIYKLQMTIDYGKSVENRTD